MAQNTRRAFISALGTTLGASGAALGAATVAASAATPAPSPPAAPSPPGPSPTPAPSEAARAFAATMRRFDSQLSDEEIATIAGGIDGNLKLGGKLNPKGRRLPNNLGPVTVFIMKA